MSERRPSFAPGLVLAQVSLRVVVPLLGGAVAGLLVDSIGHTAPQFVLIGILGGTLVSFLWIRAFIASNLARIRREDEARASRPEGHEHTTIEPT